MRIRTNSNKNTKFTMKLRVGYFYMTFALVFSTFTSSAQSYDDVFMIKLIYQRALSDRTDYDLLKELTSLGPRMSGSTGYKRAAKWIQGELRQLPFDTIWTQSVEVLPWERGNEEWIHLYLNGDTIPLTAATLGFSGGLDTPITGSLSVWDDVDSLRRFDGDLQGAVVYFNRPMDQTRQNMFRSYSGAVDQRVYGPKEAAKKGAAATIIRSIASDLDDDPHTGVTIFDEVPPIPALALSTNDAEYLDDLIARGTMPRVGVMTDAKMNASVEDVNVIAEVRGSVHPDEIILAGGHLDSWDLGTGAHDDGAGCIHAIEAFRLLLDIGYKPKRTWRCVLFANEEQGLAGGRTYAQSSMKHQEQHIAAIESDAGGYIPYGFSFEAKNDLNTKMNAIRDNWGLLEPYHLQIEFTGSGADISPLKGQGALLIGLRVHSHEYFDIHHSAGDMIDAVHPRSLSLGASAMASMIYLLDKYGLDHE